MEFLSLDIKTLLRLLAMANLFAIAMLLAYKREGQEQPLCWFVVSRGLQMVGWGLLSLRGEIPFVLSMHGANSVLFAGFSLEMIALTYYAPGRQFLMRLYVGFQVCGMALLWVYQETLTGLIIVASTWVILLVFPAAIALLRGANRSNPSRLQKSIAAFLLVLCAACVWRIHDAITMDITLFTRSIGQSLTYVALFALMVVGSSGFMLLMKERADAALISAYQRLRLSLRGGRLATWEWNVASNINRMDDAWLGMLGYVQGDVPETYEGFRSLMHPDDVAAMETAVADHLTRKSEFYEVDFRLRAKDGNWRWIHAGGVGVEHDAQGHVLHMAGIHMDITAQRQAEMAKQAFVSMVSHELRTPMNAIIGMNLRLSRTELTAQQKDYAGKIGKSSELLLRVINDILDFSKLEAGKLRLQHAPFLLDDVLTRVVDIIGVATDERGLRLTVDVAPDVPPALIGDGLRLEQVLINLVGNAAKFTEAGEITLSVRLDHCETTVAALLFSVRDTGIGIAKDDLARLFQPFSQVDGFLARRQGGTGLGLAISSQLVEMMGGKLRAESTPGVGSNFQFVVHLAVDVEAQAKTAPPQVHAPLQPISATLHGRHVLLVEDNAFNRQVAAETLGDVGIIVEQASNGQEAVDKVLARTPDIVLMDIQMPVMDGLEATHQIHKLPGMEKLPIIAMTAHGMPQMRQQGMAAGFKDYLIKPIQPDDLYAALARCLLPGAKQPEQPGIADTSTNTIPPLPSIDAALALQMAGGQTSRVPIRLRQFIADMGDGGKQLQALGQRHEWTKAWQLAHALKGAAGNIGATRLQALADAYLKEESAPARTALAQDIASELALLHQRAQTFHANHAHHANSKPEAVQTTSAPAQILADIAQGIERHGHIPQEWLDALAASLDEPAAQTSLAQLQAALSRFDYAEAATHLSRLTMLQPRKPP